MIGQSIGRIEPRTNDGSICDFTLEDEMGKRTFTLEIFSYQTKDMGKKG